MINCSSAPVYSWNNKRGIRCEVSTSTTQHITVRKEAELQKRIRDPVPFWLLTAGSGSVFSLKCWIGRIRIRIKWIRIRNTANKTTVPVAFRALLFLHMPLTGDIFRISNPGLPVCATSTHQLFDILGLEQRGDGDTGLNSQQPHRVLWKSTQLFPAIRISFRL
jgi:hypothetical protein